MARHAPGPLSDIDLIVVMQTQERFLDRLKRAYEEIQPRVAMDISIYTPEEFSELSEMSPWVRHALKESRELYVA